MTVGTVEQTTDNKGGIQTRFSEQTGDQAGGGGFAVGAGYRNAIAEAHDFGEHFCARHHRNTLFARRLHFRVLFVNRARHHHHVAAVHMTGVMPDQDARTQSCKSARDSVFTQVRPAHLVPQVEQHFGNSTHTCTTDTDKMRTVNAPHAVRLPRRLLLCSHHAASFQPLASIQALATRCAASGSAAARAHLAIMPSCCGCCSSASSLRKRCGVTSEFGSNTAAPASTR